MPPSIPAEVTANARYHEASAFCSDKRKNEAHLELLVNALKAIDGCIECADFAGSDFELLLEILNLAEVRVTLGSVLGLELVL